MLPGVGAGVLLITVELVVPGTEVTLTAVTLLRSVELGEGSVELSVELGEGSVELSVELREEGTVTPEHKRSSWQ